MAEDVWLHRDASTLFFTDLYIKAGGERGNEYSWTCPLCTNERVPWDLLLPFVTNFAIHHLRTKHNVERDIEFEAKEG